MPTEPDELIRGIAATTVEQMAHAFEKSGRPASDVLISLETALVIAVVAFAEAAAPDDELRYARELLAHLHFNARDLVAVILNNRRRQPADSR